MNKIIWFLKCFFGKKYFIKFVDTGLQKDEVLFCGHNIYILKNKEEVMEDKVKKEAIEEYVEEEYIEVVGDTEEVYDESEEDVK